MHIFPLPILRDQKIAISIPKIFDLTTLVIISDNQCIGLDWACQIGRALSHTGHARFA